jgi:hypothetical protein
MATVDKNLENEIPIACDLTAIPIEQREQHRAAAEQLFASVLETRELPTGHAFRLPEEPEMLLKTAEFISLERLCCPFFNFALEVEPNGGPLWLKLTGGEGVKPFIESAFALQPN